ncbi:MAG: hypothetical protein NC048_07430 [Bacteroides sp.]|nr:hypothetical protein [Ruminococcus flavefaciens]MCM1555311.1 hypothetical protein [Bacteroides sp.]
MSAYKEFITKLDAFLSRFYVNKAWKGFFVLFAVSLAVFLVFCVLEYVFYLPVGVRTWLFWLFTVLFLTGFTMLVLYPLGQGRGWFKRMSHEKAACYLAARYPELDDRLYNVLDLRQQLQENESLYGLLEAAIEQISRGFVAYRFEKSVRFRTNLKYLLSVAAVLLIIAAVYLVNPKVIGSSERIVRYGRTFEREFPFKITIANNGLRVAYEEDFTLNLSVDGDMLPSEVFIETDRRLVPCRKNSAIEFSHTFKKVRQRIKFHIVSGKYRSAAYTLEVDYKPLMSGMKITLRYPEYMGKKAEVVDNSLNLSVPAGTRVEWELKIDHAAGLSAGFMPSGNKSEIQEVHWEEAAAQSPVFSFSRQIFQSCNYLLVPQAFTDIKADTSSFFIEAVPDGYPRIETVQLFDSTRPYRRYFHGMISDDYGFHSLIFKLSCSNASTGSEWTFFDTLSVKVRELSQEFTYYFDIDEFNPQPGDELSYGFELRDNDAFYPFKAVYSPVFSYRKMSQEEVRDEVSRTSASVDSKFSLSLQSVQRFDNELQELVQDLLSRKQLSWQDQKRVELLLEQQEQLRETYRELSEEIQQKQRLESELNETDSELQEKQRQLQELMDQLFDDATMKKLEELQELMRQNAPREKITDALEDVRRQKDLLSRDIERNLNLYKQLEFENKLSQAVSDANRLAEQSKEVSEQMKRISADSALKLQEELQKGRERLEQDLKRVEELNEKLEKKTSFSMPDSLLQKARKDIEDTKSDLQDGNEKSARRNQEKTNEDLQQLADNLSGQMDRIEEENEAEDADFIRLLLKSTVRVSVQQENLMEALGNTKLNDPRYAEQIRRQSALNTEIRFIADSIQAIAKRQPQVALATHQEVKNMLSYSRETLDLLLAMNNVYYTHYNTTNSRALARQQYTMTSLNNLALLLSESLDRMQQQMNMKGNSGSSKKKQKGTPQMSCPKPGEKNSSMPIPSMESMMKQGRESLQQMQKDLNRQLDELKKMLEQLQKQGQPKNAQEGKQSKPGESGNAQGEQISEEKVSESFARAAAKQEMIRRMLQQKMQEEKIKNPGAAGLYNRILGDMETTERDLVNKILNDRVLSRQKNIETRLLEAENAELKREQDDKRESKTGNTFSPFMGDSLENAGKKKMPGNDLLRFSYPELRPYYKKKVQDFLFETERK